jgi:hypothetical protein
MAARMIQTRQKRVSGGQSALQSHLRDARALGSVAFLRLSGLLVMKTKSHDQEDL